MLRFERFEIAFDPEYGPVRVRGDFYADTVEDVEAVIDGVHISPGNVMRTRPLDIEMPWRPGPLRIRGEGQFYRDRGGISPWVIELRDPFGKLWRVTLEHETEFKSVTIPPTEVFAQWLRRILGGAGITDDAADRMAVAIIAEIAVELAQVSDFAGKLGDASPWPAHPEIFGPTSPAARIASSRRDRDAAWRDRDTARADARAAREETSKATEELDAMRKRFKAMHRRAQKAEGALAHAQKHGAGGSWSSRERQQEAEERDRAMAAVEKAAKREEGKGDH